MPFQMRLFDALVVPAHIDEVVSLGCIGSVEVLS